ncbi:CCA tRNA nucleotidyltransferase [Methanothermococcus okinawensis]|uniref:CCA-adding enzyme n=1 Tax=Methanothermococcus okinawensis (strain DSM 14208 / JCM 11175 / IH1) TaxID=647113 RepID=F8AN23_METOI|nr:CCA tRNA nucleotidyltransferase [Methanothermococcus okinawensis]AEH06937.1 CCA-adding enzyme [Methanothermococcus okinawensis IH1]
MDKENFELEDVKEVLDGLLNDISPSKEEETKIKEFSKKIINELYDELNNEKLRHLIVDIVQVGSTARNTNLKNDYDIDIFIRFKKGVDKEVLKETVLKIGKKVIEKLNGKYWIEYAEHPYISAKIGRYDIDIVPCYKLNWGENIVSAVDRTPLHNEFLKKMLKSNTLNNEVRLLKKFLKGIGIYGSDLKTKGFSGYLCELLIIHYGGFINTLIGAQKWKLGKKIILNEIYNIYKLNKDYKFADFKDPLVVYDPVDLNRNVAAALSKENFCKFIFYSYQFLKNPSKDFFYDYHKNLNEKLGNRKKGMLFTLGIRRNKDIVDDVIYPQMEKLQKSINKILIENDFEFLRCGNYADDDMCYLSWEFLVWELPNIKLKIGPPVFNKKGVDNFIKKNDKYFVKDCNVCAYVERNYKNVDELFEAIAEGKLKKKISYPKYVSPENAVIFKGIYKEYE